jgi:hypothetical protein
MQILMTTLILAALAWVYWTGRTVADWRVSDDDLQRRAWRVWVWPATALVWAFLTSSHKTAAAVHERLPGGSSLNEETEALVMAPDDEEDIPM